MRTYAQFCALARSLDVLGERWTLLLIRELMLGPQRFSDLYRALPGIGPNLLSSRLSRLQEEGIIRPSRLPPPAASDVYELTARGHGLEEPVLALARWGMDPIAPPRPEEHRQPHWYAIAMWAAFRPEAASHNDEEYELQVDGETFHFELHDGKTRARRGPARAPAFVLRTDLESFFALATRAREPTAAELDGDRSAFDRFVTAHALPRPET